LCDVSRFNYRQFALLVQQVIGVFTAAMWANYAALTGALKLQDWTLTDDFAGVDIAGLDIDELNLNGKISFLEKIFTPSPEKQS